MLSNSNRALFTATAADLERMYAKCVFDPVPVWDPTGGEHVVWNGAHSGMMSIRSVLVPVSRLALFGYTGKLYARSEKLCEVPGCVHPEHHEWDTGSQRLHPDTFERAQKPGILNEIKSRGWVHHRFKA